MSSTSDLLKGVLFAACGALVPVLLFAPGAPWAEDLAAREQRHFVGAFLRSHSAADDEFSLSSSGPNAVDVSFGRWPAGGIFARRHMRFLLVKHGASWQVSRIAQLPLHRGAINAG